MSISRGAEWGGACFRLPTLSEFNQVYTIAAALRVLRTYRSSRQPFPRRSIKHASPPRLEPLEARTLLNAGDLDPTFGIGGKVLTDFVGTIARSPSGGGLFSTERPEQNWCSHTAARSGFGRRFLFRLDLRSI